MVSHQWLANRGEVCDENGIYFIGRQLSAVLVRTRTILPAQNDSICLGSRTLETFHMHLAVSQTATLLAICFLYI